MPDICLEGVDVPYVLRYNRRNRNVRLTVSLNGGVHVSAPYGVPRRFIEGFMRERSDWILQHLRKQETVRQLSGSFWTEGSKLPFLDGRLCLQVSPLYGDPSILRLNGSLLVTIPAGTGVPVVRDLVLQWYRRQAQAYIPARTWQFAAAMRVRPAAITIRHQRSRWGSCSADGRLNFNLKLLMVPADVLDYVLVHELAHLNELNHSRAFWRIVLRHCPSAMEHRNWLRANAWLLEA